MGRTSRWRGILMVMVVVIGALAGCSGAAPAATTTKDVDLSTLPDVVDSAMVNGLLGNEDVLILDVREQYEYDAGHIPGVKLIPLAQVPQRLSEIPKDKPVIVTCRTGNRSSQTVTFLRNQGYNNVHDMAGGIVAWERAGYEVVK